MAISFDTGTTSVTGSVAVTVNGNLPLPATGQTNIDSYATKTNSGTIISRANTAGKTVYLYGLDFNVITAAGGVTDGKNITIADNATTLYVTSNLSNGSIRFPKPLVITSTLVISWTAQGATDVIRCTATAMEQ